MAESVEQQFPHPELSPLSSTDKPANTSLKPLKKQLNANAMSIPSVQGGGSHGHLALTIPAARYLTIVGIAFTAPLHPGPAPIHIAGATGHQITETNRQYAAELKEFRVFTSVEANLKKEIIQAVPDTYINELNDDILGYANTTTLSLLAHLDTTYGTVTADNLNTNLDDLQRAWTSAQPLEDLWKQIRQCRLFANDHDPISELMAVRSALLNLETAGVFSDAVKDWRKLPVVDHTLTKLKAHFNTTDRERLRQLTTRSAGFHAKDINTSDTAYSARFPPAPAIVSPTNSTTPISSNTSALYYCWSHGLGPNNGHTSANC
jgi:hypothetical protein